MSAAARRAPFAGWAILTVVVVATVGFIAFLVFSAYAPDFRPMKNGGAHALSTSAVGFAGTTELVRMVRGGGDVVRRDAELGDEGLLILTPSVQTSPAEIEAILDRREDMSTLIVLPKWAVERLSKNRAWVRARGVFPSPFVMAPLRDIVDATVSQPDGPGELRTISGRGLRVVERTPEGGPLLVALDDTPHFILADPDILNNKALATRDGAARAMALIDLVSGGQPVRFDLTLMGFGRNPNLLKLAFEPPFLPLTLCLLFAAILAALHAAWRFGPAAQEERAVAYGKRGLAENGAALLRLANRRHRTGGRYAMLTRDAAAAASGAPAGLSGEALDTYLDRLGGDEPFSQLAGRAERAPDTRRLLAAARALYHWRRTVTRDHR